MRRLPLGPDSAGLIVSTSTLDHFDDPADPWKGLNGLAPQGVRFIATSQGIDSTPYSCAS